MMKDLTRRALILDNPWCAIISAAGIVGQKATPRWREWAVRLAYEDRSTRSAVLALSAILRSKSPRKVKQAAKYICNACCHPHDKAYVAQCAAEAIWCVMFPDEDDKE